jgi:hypothetical protein
MTNYIPQKELNNVIGTWVSVLRKKNDLVIQ